MQGTCARTLRRGDVALPHCVSPQIDGALAVRDVFLFSGSRSSGGENLRLVPGLSLRATTICLVSIASLASARADAQKRALRGIVADSAGKPIPRADVSIASLRLLTQTDDSGRFVLDGISRDSVEVSVRRLSYEPRAILVATATAEVLQVVLKPHPALLSAVNVNAGEWRRREMIEEFYRRRIKGVGQYITREEIENRWGGAPSDLFRTVPGIRFIRTASGRGIRFPTTSIRARDCPPMIWIDGQKAPGMEIDDVPLADVEGIEIYGGPSTTPLQFSQAQTANTCGTIVVWSRPPPPSYRTP